MEYADVLEIERPATAELSLDDLSLLRLDEPEQADEILIQYHSMDIPKDHIDAFRLHLLSRNDSWFVQVADVGLIYLTVVIPTFTATFNVMFWDKRFGKNRREMCQAVIATAFDEFDLTRLTAAAPVTNKALAEVELRKIGFVQEGVLRKGWRMEEKQDVDLVVFGLLRSEVKNWPLVDHLKVKINAG